MRPSLIKALDRGVTGDFGEIWLCGEEIWFCGSGEDSSENRDGDLKAMTANP